VSQSIDRDVLDVLRGSSFDGNGLFLKGILDRQLYLKTAKVIEALGGKWNRRAKSHVFPEDAADICADAIVTGCYVDAKKQFDFFETPVGLARELVELAGVKSGDRVLEPSAGGGRIADAAVEAGGSVYCVELQKPLSDKLCDRGLDVLVQHDFLQVKPEEIFGGLFDAVVQNPPFSRGQDMAHVRHAYEFLKPGGRLVSVMGSGYTFRSDRKARAFRDWMFDVEGTCDKLPDGTFKESGTMVSTVVVQITK